MTYRDSAGRFAKAPATKVAATYNVKRNVQEIRDALNGGDFATIKAKVSTFLGKVEPTTPLEEVVVAMLREYCN